MKIIESIRIKYFRSILNTTRGNQTHLKTNELNVIVGSNDAGKSNYLRALSLFFNNYSEPGLPFSFWNDYSRQRLGIKREENRIEIELVINPPKKQYFKNNGPVRWTKVWREATSHPEESIEYLDGSKFTNNKRSSYYKWLRKIRFRYVPAIKSERYFNDLMHVLYDVLQKDTQTLEQEFNRQVGEKTNLISKEIESRLNIDSVLQFKGSFRDLFLSLEFGSRDGKSMLSQRGDGIKVRHIPVVLQNIAEAELKETRRREPIASTIWGFEEPENNLEFESARHLSESFLEYISQIHFQDESISEFDEGIQIFLTTHSPVFYTLANIENPKINSFVVKKQKDHSSEIKFIQGQDSLSIESEMKLLPLLELSNHWKILRAKIDNLEKVKSELKTQLNSFNNADKCIFLTEDKDKRLLKILLESNEFNLDQIDLRSYKGCTNIMSAEMLGAYLRDKFGKKCPAIIVHIDKDYLTQEEIDSKKIDYQKKDIHLFVTKGTDIESYFLNLEHICDCHRGLAKEEIEKLLKSAKSDTKNHAVSRLKRKEFGEKYQNKSSHLESYFEKLYDSKEDEFFHGKEVLKRFRHLFQSHFQMNVDLIKTTKYLKDQYLKHLVEIIWDSNIAH